LIKYCETCGKPFKVRGEKRKKTAKYCSRECRTIVIQFDGDYWHGNPRKYPVLTERQKKQVKRDRAQDAYLISCGYRVIRIWESDLKTDSGILRRRIDEVLQEMRHTGASDHIF